MGVENTNRIAEKLITLDRRYSTTQIVSEIIPKLNFAKEYETKMFFNGSVGNRAEGGLRKRGFFKYSYEIENYNTDDEVWWACDFVGRRLFEVTPPDNFNFDLNKFKLENGLIKLPLISIVTAVRNGKVEIANTIESIIEQKYPNVEYLVIDGASTDGTIESIKEYEYVIDYWISEYDQGIYDAMNKGIVLSFGTLVNFLNSRDRFCGENVLENVVEKIKAELSEHNIFYGNHIIDYSNYKVEKKPGKISNYWKGMQICHQSIFFSATFHKQNKYQMGLSADYALLLKASKNNPKLFYYIGLNIAEYNFEGTSVRHWLKFYLDAMRYSIQCENRIFKKMSVATYHLSKIFWQFLKNGIKNLIPKSYLEKYRKCKTNFPW